MSGTALLLNLILITAPSYILLLVPFYRWENKRRKRVSPSHRTRIHTQVCLQSRGSLLHANLPQRKMKTKPLVPTSPDLPLKPPPRENYPPATLPRQARPGPAAHLLFSCYPLSRTTRSDSSTKAHSNDLFPMVLLSVTSSSFECFIRVRNCTKRLLVQPSNCLFQNYVHSFITPLI